MFIHLVKSCTATKRHIPFDIFFSRNHTSAGFLYNYQLQRERIDVERKCNFLLDSSSFLKLRAAQNRKTRVSLNSFELAGVPPRKISFGSPAEPLLSLGGRFASRSGDRIRFFALRAYSNRWAPSRAEFRSRAGSTV